MPDIEETAGSPVSVVIIGAENLDVSLGFYADTLGLEVKEKRTWQGPEFEKYWNLPPGSSAQCAFVQHGPDPVGRILLMEFDSSERKLARPAEIHRATGLFNLNIYTRDIAADYAKLVTQGFHFWSDPTENDFGPYVGKIIEVAFDAPDGVVINLIQLVTEDPKTLIGQIRVYITENGRTSTGFTAVATTSHGVVDMEKAVAFYYEVLNMKLFMESTLEGAEMNRTLGLPEDAKTRSVFVRGDHEYGKIALSSPLNYETDSLVQNQVPPNIGYLAQAFQVPNLETAMRACDKLDVEIFCPAIELDLPGRGMCRSTLVHNPGSGALQELFQPIPSD
jgi:catechol 2,3-dioxygenase-like lactoylglutathione lyase family enzyme